MLFPRGPSLRKSDETQTRGEFADHSVHEESPLSPIATMRARASTFLLSSFRGLSKDTEDTSDQHHTKENIQESQNDSYANKFVIALLGPSGAGKSSFIAHATGQDVKVGHLLTACTDCIETYEKRCSNDRTVVFIDTPGYDLADKNPNRVLNLLTQWLKAQSAGGKPVNLNAILFFHRITDNRMPVATQSHINRFEKLVGKKGAPKRIILITTMWDELDYRIGASREDQLRREFWKRFLDGGSEICRFRRSGVSAWEILHPLVGGNTENVPLPSILDNIFHEEPEEEPDLDADQALNTMEQIYHEQQRLLERLQAIVQNPSGKQTDALREVLVEEKKVSGKLGSLLNRLKRQNHRWFRLGHSGTNSH